MASLILDQKLESLRRCLSRIDDKTPSTLGELIDSVDLQDILVLNLTRAVQLCIDIGSHVISGSEEPTPATMGEVFVVLHRLGAISDDTALALRRAVGFRNVAVHNYGVINWEIVFSICGQSLNDFRQFAIEVTKYLQS
jgi:uncharacterized protein YutE (UPF0331/DUF86 family)